MSTIVKKIQESQLTIYDHIDELSSDLYIVDIELEKLIREHIIGKNFSGMPLRTRAKEVKSEICKSLGYPVPNSFVKTQPRFPGQNFDVYTQSATNLQIWNEPIDPLRRYIILHLDNNDTADKIKLIKGFDLAKLDTTGKLTTKYQATMKHYGASKLFTSEDTSKVKAFSGQNCLKNLKPNAKPNKGDVLPIAEIYQKLLPIVGCKIRNLHVIQDRNRGSLVHKMICEHLGYSEYRDNGTYPDILNQILEIKTQTSPTIDLGQHSPTDGTIVYQNPIVSFNSEDIRYAIIDSHLADDFLCLDSLYIINGKDFPDYFPLFGGKVKNAKIQIPLPKNFFE